MKLDDCIAALATAPGAAGVCIVRVSGMGALEIGDRLLPSVKKKPSQRPAGTFFHADIVHPETHERIDDAVILIYRAPFSYTGEDSIEFQGHGGRVPARRLLAAVLAAGARLADPGEFTKRAFLNGRMDLTQAEGVCDLIQAKSDRAAQVARAQLEGSLGKQINQLYEDVTAVCADVEHLLDFDEGELPESFGIDAGVRMLHWVERLERLIDSWNEGHLLREGAQVVICGRPNSGKSSLLNALLGQDRAIVHAVPGTTRDAIEESYLLDGMPLRLVDTAGLRETDDVVERKGIERARELIRQADLILYLIDGSTPTSAPIGPELAALPKHKTLVGVTKSDLPAGERIAVPDTMPCVRLSVVTGEGLEALNAEMAQALGMNTASSGQPIVALRHVTELRQAAAQGHAAQEAILVGAAGLVLAAGHLRAAAEALGRIIGRIYSDDLLDAVFARFCVGK